MTTCTSESVAPNRPGDGFSVSLTTGAGIAGAVLNVSRTRWLDPDQAARFNARGTGLSMVIPRFDGKVCVLFRMPDHGRVFESREAADRFKLERGYVRPWYPSPELRAQRRETARLFPHVEA